MLRALAPMRATSSTAMTIRARLAKRSAASSPRLLAVARAVADLLHRSHERQGEEGDPEEPEPELRAGLRVGCDPRWIVVGRPGDQAGPEGPEVPPPHGAACRAGDIDPRAVRGRPTAFGNGHESPSSLRRHVRPPGIPMLPASANVAAPGPVSRGGLRGGRKELQPASPLLPRHPHQAHMLGIPAESHSRIVLDEGPDRPGDGCGDDVPDRHARTRAGGRAGPGPRVSRSRDDAEKVWKSWYV